MTSSSIFSVSIREKRVCRGMTMPLMKAPKMACTPMISVVHAANSVTVKATTTIAGLMVPRTVQRVTRMARNGRTKKNMKRPNATTHRKT